MERWDCVGITLLNIFDLIWAKSIKLLENLKFDFIKREIKCNFSRIDYEMGT